ncbi:MAG: response regulator [Fimbriimonas sp.]|nr:response regulator [Fimbriimonas sp.]
MDSILRVIYIEDDELNRKVIVKLFEYLDDFRCYAAPDVETGMSLVHEVEPHLVLLDLHVRGVHGRDVLERLRRDPETASIPVVIISGDVSPEERDGMTKLGVMAYLQKPVEFSALIEVTRTVRARIAPPD